MKQAYVLLKDKLNEEYKAAFDRIEIYGDTSLIGTDEESELLMELLDNMLMSQAEGKPVTDIVGNDIDVFCKNFYSDYTIRDRINNFFGRMCFVAVVIFVFEVSILLFDSEGSIDLWTVSNMGGYIVGLFGGFLMNLVVIAIIKPASARFKNIKPSFWSGCMIATFIIGMIAVFNIAEMLELKIPMWIPIFASAVYIIVYTTVKSVRNYRAYGSVRKPKQESISFMDALNESVSTDLRKELPETWLKRYRKLSAKAVRKGKEPLTEEKYLAKLSKQYNVDRIKLQNNLIFGGITILFIIGFELDGEFETMADAIIFPIILIVMEFFMCRAFNKTQTKASYIFAEMKKNMQENDITLEQYVQSISNE